MLNGIDNIGLAVLNLPASLKFYEALGFKKTWENEKSCMVSLGPVVLFLFETNNRKPAKIERQAPDLFNNPVGVDYVAFAVDNVDSYYDALTAKNITFALNPADQEWGARMAAVKDPDGNVLYFIQRYC